jgi:hypothetical protein
MTLKLGHLISFVERSKAKAESKRLSIATPQTPIQMKIFPSLSRLFACRPNLRCQGHKQSKSESIRRSGEASLIDCVPFIVSSPGDQFQFVAPRPSLCQVLPRRIINP